MDSVLTALVEAITAGGTAAIWVAVGWFAHKIALAWIITWGAVRIVSKIMDAIMARVVLHGFIEKIAIACGMQTPLSPAEQEQILSRLHKL